MEGSVGLVAFNDVKVTSTSGGVVESVNLWSGE